MIFTTENKFESWVIDKWETWKTYLNFDTDQLDDCLKNDNHIKEPIE